MIHSVVTKKNSQILYLSREGYQTRRVFFKPPTISTRTIFVKPQPQYYRTTRRIPKALHPAWMVISVLMTVSFLAGMVTVWQTQLSAADTESDRFASQQLGGLVTKMSLSDSEPNIIADLLPILIEQNRHKPTAEEIASTERRDKLRSYLATKKSPLAKDEAALDAFLSSNNMEMMLAISFVEGNFCKHHIEHNCSGIGGSKMRKYESFAGWVRDFDSLLERKYKGLKVEQFIGYYVVPGSENWKLGVYQILDELKAGGIK